MSKQEKLSVDMTDEQIQSLSQRAYERTLITPDTIYLELGLMRDFYIGTLLTFIEELPSQKAKDGYYRYVFSKLPEWDKRYFNDIGHHFPDIGITGEQVIERMKDPKYSENIFALSPTTSFIHLFDGHITLNTNHSRTIGKDSPIVVTVNTYPIHANDIQKKLVGNFMNVSYGVDTIVICKDPSTFTPQELDKFEELYTGSMGLLSRGPGIAEAFSTMFFSNKRIFSTAIHGNKYESPFDKDRVVRWLTYLEKHYGVFCEYKVIPPQHISVLTSTESKKE